MENNLLVNEGMTFPTYHSFIRPCLCSLQCLCWPETFLVALGVVGQKAQRQGSPNGGLDYHRALSSSRPHQHQQPCRSPTVACPYVVYAISRIRKSSPRGLHLFLHGGQCKVQQLVSYFGRDVLVCPKLLDPVNFTIWRPLKVCGVPLPPC